MIIKDNIELRSEKVQRIIGQIPPRIIRMGITVFFFIFLLLGASAYFYEFPHKLKAKAYLWQVKDSIAYEVHIPVHRVNQIKTNALVKFNLRDNSTLEVFELKSRSHTFDSTVMVNNNGTYKTLSGCMPALNYYLSDTLKTNAVIYTDTVNVVEWLLKKR